jgi:hypothetical protein
VECESREKKEEILLGDHLIMDGINLYVKDYKTNFNPHTFSNQNTYVGKDVQSTQKILEYINSQQDWQYPQDTHPN